ncbi:patatin-like phospholipase family protein [Metabacillus sp. KIGAM252]|uniref:Patatin-like phospholipase family protein n=1 Tax=Metabacillus flavus TaxID=2823519 RepID=A0ABS5LG77_9BACI|nr:patatin-like phospholipase family protein [Metabacillus flavus]
MYIDGVFSGGGIKGLAMAGACQAIEKKGLRFARIAGTSAGSIIAAFIAAGYTSDEIIDLLEEVNLKDFMDERISFFPLRFLKWISIYWRLGLYKGQKLENWIAEKLRVKGISTFGDLPAGSLKVVASDLTNGKIVVLPDDLPSYGLVPENFSVARAVRMSSSLPYFFEPVKLTSRLGNCMIVDGGVLSNFPIWLFTAELFPKRPVLGIRLTPNEQERPKNKITNAIELYGALFETMKDAHDARHISSKHERNIVFLPVDHILTTEFNLTEEKKLALIELGRSETEKFLQTWAF